MRHTRAVLHQAEHTKSEFADLINDPKGHRRIFATTTTAVTGFKTEVLLRFLAESQGLRLN
ncbi:hypothetical protein [Marinobacter sp. LV10MA510-1]|uniref:hypothetical protein n=1 Tax=Marinobacter sp. LV10MA510-1 TaxID=1415567 RepID=UPI000BF2972A|nr:hypothetical protein [Marinobacter sp. LV10MA510-1]